MPQLTIAMLGLVLAVAALGFVTAEDQNGGPEDVSWEQLKIEEDTRLLSYIETASPDDLNTPNASGDTVLHYASHYCLPQSLQKLIDIIEIDLEVEDDQGRSPLHRAMANREYECMHTLLDNGANANHRTPQHTPLLHVAATLGDITAVRLLLDSGRPAARVNARHPKDQSTALHEACRFGHWRVAAALLNRGAKATLYTQNNETPLILALHPPLQLDESEFEEGTPERDALDRIRQFSLPANCADAAKLVDMIIDASTRATADRGENGGYKPKDDVRDLLLDTVKDTGLGPLHLALQTGCPEVVDVTFKRLQPAPSDLAEAVGEHQVTVLHVAVSSGDMEMVRRVLEGLKGSLAPPGTNERKNQSQMQKAIDAQDSEGQTPLHWAAYLGSQVVDAKEIAEALIAGGANIHATNKVGMTPLHMAALKGTYSVAQALIKEMDANVRQGRGSISMEQFVGTRTEGFGWTPLHLAAMGGTDNYLKAGRVPTGEEVDKFLHDEEVRTMGVGKANHMPNPSAGAADATEQASAEEIEAIREFKSTVEKIHSDFRVRKDVRGEANATDETENDFSRVVALLLLSNASPLEHGQYEMDAVHLASIADNVPTLKLLVAAGAGLGNTNDRGQTAIHLAAMEGSINSLKYLLESIKSQAVGDDASQEGVVNVRDAKLLTPLHYAAKYGECDHEESIASILLGAGAMVEAKATHSTTPLHLAALSGHPSCVRVLSEAGANANLVLSNGATPMHLACAQLSASVDTVRELVRAGAELVGDHLKDRVAGLSPVQQCLTDIEIRSKMKKMFVEEGVATEEEIDEMSEKTDDVMKSFVESMGGMGGFGQTPGSSNPNPIPEAFTPPKFTSPEGEGNGPTSEQMKEMKASFDGLQGLLDELMAKPAAQGGFKGLDEVDDLLFPPLQDEEFREAFSQYTKSGPAAQTETESGDDNDVLSQDEL